MCNIFVGKFLIIVVIKNDHKAESHLHKFYIQKLFYY